MSGMFIPAGRVRTLLAGLSLETVVLGDAVRGDAAWDGHKTRRTARLQAVNRADDGVAFARDLDFVRKTVNEEKFAIPSAMALFPSRTDVPIGAKTYTSRRGTARGFAVIYRAGKSIPRVDVGSSEETRSVKYIVDGYGIDDFERNSSDFAGANVEGRLARAARQIVYQKYNDLAWYGDAKADLWGVLTYPYLRKVVSTVNFSTATADQMLVALNAIDINAADRTNGVFYPDTLAVSPRILHRMSTTRMGAGDGALSVLNTFLANAIHIRKVVQAWELRGTGPGGYDGLFAYRNDEASINHVMVGGFNQTPVQREGFTSVVNCFQGFGGVTMEDVANNLLTWAAAA